MDSGAHCSNCDSESLDSATWVHFSICVYGGLYQGSPPWPSDTISIESNGISNRSNRNSQKFSNGRKIARMARILTIFGRNRSSRRNLSFQKFSNERKIIELIESIDSIGRSIDRSYQLTATLFFKLKMCIIHQRCSQYKSSTVMALKGHIHFLMMS